jgi:hypothetical protein
VPHWQLSCVVPPLKIVLRPACSSHQGCTGVGCTELCPLPRVCARCCLLLCLCALQWVLLLSETPGSTREDFEDAFSTLATNLLQQQGQPATAVS